MSRRRKPPPPGTVTVQFTCVDRYHDGGRYRAAIARLEDGGITAVKRITETPRPEGAKWEITCRCGITASIPQADAAEIATALLAASPGAASVDIELIALQSEAGRQWLRAGGAPWLS